MLGMIQRWEGLREVGRNGTWMGSVSSVRVVPVGICVNRPSKVPVYMCRDRDARSARRSPRRLSTLIPLWLKSAVCRTERVNWRVYLGCVLHSFGTEGRRKQCACVYIQGDKVRSSLGTKDWHSTLNNKNMRTKVNDIIHVFELVKKIQSGSTALTRSELWIELGNAGCLDRVKQPNVLVRGWRARLPRYLVHDCACKRLSLNTSGELVYIQV
jgi:hypothetical protein